MKTILVTGGAGFIGSCYVLAAVKAGYRVVNLDKLTYSGNLDNLEEIKDSPLHVFVRGDIGNFELVQHLCREYLPDFVVNFAAESHVDRSILDPEAFVCTNVLGTCSLLRAVKEWRDGLDRESALYKEFRFLHVSTDEVFGALKPGDPAFTEKTAFAPNSLYSASKASSDHFVRAYFETYGFPCLITNCSNNYGPRQFPEKLIPLVTLNALKRKTLPVYGTGENIRDWLHVEDHCEAIQVGETYCIGGNSERTNIDVVRTICSILDELCPHADGKYKDLIEFVADRLGHDFRYAIDCTKIKTELGWEPKHNFRDGLAATVRWYLENEAWTQNVQSGEYRRWIDKNYTGR